MGKVIPIQLFIFPETFDSSLMVQGREKFKSQNVNSDVFLIYLYLHFHIWVVVQRDSGTNIQYP